MPKRNGEMQPDGNHELRYNENFEGETEKILHEGMLVIKNFREEKSNFFT